MLKVIGFVSKRPEENPSMEFDFTDEGLSSCKNLAMELLVFSKVESVLIRFHKVGHCFRMDSDGLSGIRSLSLADFFTEYQTPNDITLSALNEIESGNIQKFTSKDEFFNDLKN